MRGCGRARNRRESLAPAEALSVVAAEVAPARRPASSRGRSCADRTLRSVLSPDRYNSPTTYANTRKSDAASSAWGIASPTAVAAMATSAPSRWPETAAKRVAAAARSRFPHEPTIIAEVVHTTISNNVAPTPASSCSASGATGERTGSSKNPAAVHTTAARNSSCASSAGRRPVANRPATSTMRAGAAPMPAPGNPSVRMNPSSMTVPAMPTNELLVRRPSEGACRKTRRRT